MYASLFPDLAMAFVEAMELPASLPHNRKGAQSTLGVQQICGTLVTCLKLSLLLAASVISTPKTASTEVRTSAMTKQG